MMNEGPFSLSFNAEQATQEILEKILANPSRYDWLLDYMQRNNESIKGLIENDTFGSLSDFPEQYPQATLQDKLLILKAYIENQSLENFDVVDITIPLKDFIDNVSMRVRNLDNALLSSQYHFQTSWGVKFPANMDYFLKTLDQIQILNLMERWIQTTSTSEQDALNSLHEWLKQKRDQLANNSTTPTSESSWKYYLTGTNQFSKLIREEIQSLMKIFQKIKSTVTKLATLQHLPFLFILRDGILATFALGSIFLLPYRLLLTTCKVATRLLGESTKQAIHFLFPSRSPHAEFSASLLGWGVSIFAFCIAISYFDFPLLMLLNFQIFPESWSLSFILELSLAFSGLELVAGISLGIGQKLYTAFQHFFRSTSAAQQVSGDIPSPIRQAENIPPLNPDQRTKLLRLLMQENNLLASSSNREQCKEQREIIGKELVNLHQSSTPYMLSQFDLRLLSQQSNLQNFDQYKPQIEQERAKRVHGLV